MTTNINPYFIITSGATGSGKTKLITEVMKYLNIETKPFIKILVDDLVENDDKYKCKVSEIINSVLD
jgi:Ni2+-binding GTPase involved in maturation of urease and hydrogenase